MSTKLLQLLKDLDEPQASVKIRSEHDGRTISAAQVAGFVMEHERMTFMRTDLGNAKLMLLEAE